MLTEPALFIIGLFTQAVLYGLFLASFVHCLRWLLYADDGWRLKTNINWPMLTVTVLVFLFSTVDLALSVPIIMITPKNERQIFEWSIFNCINDALEPVTMLIVDAVLVGDDIVFVIVHKLIKADIPLLESLWKVMANCMPSTHAVDCVFHHHCT